MSLDSSSDDSNSDDSSDNKNETTAKKTAAKSAVKPAAKATTKPTPGGPSTAKKVDSSDDDSSSSYDSSYDDEEETKAESVGVRAVLLLHGFIRDIRERLYGPIPDSIIVLCALFGSQFEECFTVGKYCDDTYKLEDNQRTVTKLKTEKPWIPGQMYGNMVIDSMDPKTHSWTFAVLRCESGMTFGIEAIRPSCFHYFAKHPEEVSTCFRRWCHCSAGYANFKLESGSTLRMVLDLKKRNLVFYIDDRCYVSEHMKYIRCKAGTFYRMTIKLDIADSSVKLLEYSQT